jgi:hypothetical protein
VIVIVMDVGFPLNVFLGKRMTTVERKQNHQFKSRGDTPRSTHVYRSSEKDWRRIMETVLMILLKNLLLMTSQVLL